MPAVEFKNVSKIFANGFIGLRDVSFSIEPNTLTYLVGESGAGKTTLMRLMIRELIPSEGEIFIDDDSITDLPDKKVPHLRRKVAVVFQDYKLIPDRTVFENVALPLEISGVKPATVREQVGEVLALVGLADRSSMFPSQLSGGELQRVSIARALVMSPKVLFADEPTGNLDPNTAMSIGELLRKIPELGTTVIVSTHDSTLLTHFPSRELHLSKGRLVKDTNQTAEKKKKEKGKAKEKPEENGEKDT